ncbi:MAG: dihydroorotate oxidase [Desulfurococcaceae archaeon]
MNNIAKYTTLKILENKKLSKTIYLIKTKTIEKISESNPPQFVMLWIPGYEAIPMSIAYSEEDEIWFIVKPIGLTTTILSRKKPGEYLGLIGPLGKPLLPLNGEKYLFIAGGSGLAPIVHYLQKLQGRECSLIYGAWSFDEIENIVDFVKEMKCSITTTCFDRQCDYNGLITDYVEKISLEKYDYIIACGPIDMLKKLAEIINRKYWFKTIFILESMIKCGLGLCGTCKVFNNREYYLCIDGPGFYLEEIGEYLW